MIVFMCGLPNFHVFCHYIAFICVVICKIFKPQRSGTIRLKASNISKALLCIFEHK